MLPLLLLLAFIGTEAAFRDVTFSSSTLGINRTFRVWTGADYDSSGTTRYPVIYYCHGCGGSYQGDSYSSYINDGGYTHPLCSISCTYPLTKPFNADFQAFTNDNDVIVVMLDGGIAGTGGCLNNWFTIQNSPGMSDTYMNLGNYFKEIVTVVDSIFPTKPEPQYRAVSGLSMGGHAALDIASQVPHLVRSVSTFCHSPTRFAIGDAHNSAKTDVQELWRNLRWHSTRTTANKGDYLYAVSREMSLGLSGASLHHEYMLTPFFRHWAFRIDSQFNFHMRMFDEERPETPTCFSYVTVYPQANAWGWEIISDKQDSGWMYLKDVTSSGFSFSTRKNLPFGYPLPSSLAITVKSAPIYSANAPYSVQKYNYRTGIFSSASQTADSAGRLSIVCNGGMGEEIGISGNGLRTPVVLLSDTVYEDICIFAGRDTAIGGILANLGLSNANGVSVYATSTGAAVSMRQGYRYVGSIPSRSKKTVDTLFVIRGEKVLDTLETATVGFKQYLQYGFVKIRINGSGIDQDKEHLIRILVADPPTPVDSSNVKIFDGRSENLRVMWGSINNNSYNVMRDHFVDEGSGNGDGVIDISDTFSIWIRTQSGFVVQDTNTWHPVICVNGQNNAAVHTVGLREYLWNRSRPNHSAEMVMTKNLSDTTPTELILRVEHLGSFSGGQKGRDASAYSFYSLKLPLKFAIAAEKGNALALQDISTPAISVSPNPFNPSTSVRIYSGRERGHLTVDIFDVRGKIVNTIFNRDIVSNVSHAVNWNGNDHAGKPLTSGIYWIRYRIGNFIKIVPVTLMK